MAKAASPPRTGPRPEGFCAYYIQRRKRKVKPQLYLIKVMCTTTRSYVYPLYNQVSGANHEFIHKYRDPKFLATLMTGSFYPPHKRDKGFYATVGHVWCFVNVLLAHALRFLGDRGKMVLPYAPRGCGLSSAEYLLRHAPPTHKRTRLGFSMAEQNVHQVVMSYVDETYVPTFDGYTKGERDSIIIILRQIIARQASVIDLSTSLLNSIANVFQSGDELASDYLNTSCGTILADLVLYSTEKEQGATVQASQSGIFSARSAPREVTAPSTNAVNLVVDGSM